MADNITPTPPLAPSLLVNQPPENKRQDKQPEHGNDNDNEKQENNDEPKTKPHHGLFDEYV